MSFKKAWKILQYRVKNKTLKWLDVFYFFQGNFRYFLHRKGLLSQRWKQRIEDRKILSNPQCKTTGECVCGCDWNKMILSDKSCDNGCYPAVRNMFTILSKIKFNYR